MLTGDWGLEWRCRLFAWVRRRDEENLYYTVLSREGGRLCHPTKYKIRIFHIAISFKVYNKISISYAPTNVSPKSFQETINQTHMQYIQRR